MKFLIALAVLAAGILTRTWELILIGGPWAGLLGGRYLGFWHLGNFDMRERLRRSKSWWN